MFPYRNCRFLVAGFNVLFILEAETGNSNWEIKCCVLFHLESLIKSTLDFCLYRNKSVKLCFTNVIVLRKYPSCVFN